MLMKNTAECLMPLKFGLNFDILIWKPHLLHVHHPHIWITKGILNGNNSWMCFAFTLFKFGWVVVNRAACMCVCGNTEQLMEMLLVLLGAENCSLLKETRKTSVSKLFQFPVWMLKCAFEQQLSFNTVFLVWTEISISSRRRAAPLATLEIVSKWPL